MTKVNSEDLIQFQRGELSKDRLVIVENELKSNKKLQQELEVLKKADFAMENYFNDFKMPKDFQLKVKKKFKKKFDLFSFLNPQFILSYSGGIATACFAFAFVYSIDPFLQLQGQRNNDIVYRGENAPDLNQKLMPKNWTVNENLNFQMVKFPEGDEQTISVNQNQTLNVGDKVLIRIIPAIDMKVSIFLDNKNKTTKIKEDLILKKGQEIQLPETIFPSQKTFKVKEPTGMETFLIKDQNDQILFKFKYQIQ